MSIDIPADFNPIVQKLIADGRFRDENEVIVEGLRLVVARESLYADIQAGIDDLEAGNRVAAHEVYAEARRRIQAVDEKNTP